MISFYKFRGEYLFLGFPRIVSRGVAFPFDEVLQLASPSIKPVPHDSLYFELRFSVDHFGRWTIVVWSMLGRLAIRCEKRGMEDVVNGPGRWELELISNGGYSFSDSEGSMTFGGQFARLIREGQVFCFEPDRVSYLELVMGGVLGQFIQGGSCLFSAVEGLGGSVFDAFVPRGGGEDWIQCG